MSLPLHFASFTLLLQCRLFWNYMFIFYWTKNGPQNCFINFDLEEGFSVKTVFSTLEITKLGLVTVKDYCVRWLQMCQNLDLLIKVANFLLKVFQKNCLQEYELSEKSTKKFAATCKGRIDLPREREMRFFKSPILQKNILQIKILSLKFE